MQIAPFTEVMSPPTVGMILGTTGARDILDRINTTFGSGVIFGQMGDPFMNRYQTFMDNVINVVAQTGQLIQTAKNVLLRNEPIRPITTDDDLFNMPACMRIPILTMPEVHTLLKDERIDGWGMAVDQLPEEDVAGRLINNGTVELTGPNASLEMVWTWKSSDPDYSFEDLDALEISRRYVQLFLKKELGPDGDRRDFTDSNGIGKIARSK